MNVLANPKGSPAGGNLNFWRLEQHMFQVVDLFKTNKGAIVKQHK